MKNVMLWIILVLMVLGIILFIGGTEFTKTFPWIKLHEWWKPIGIILMVVGFVVYLTGENWKSYLKGYKEGLYEQYMGVDKSKK